MHKLHLLDAIPSKPKWLLSQNPGVYYLKQRVQEYKTNQEKKREEKNPVQQFCQLYIRKLMKSNYYFKN